MYDMSRQVNKKENDEQIPERKIEKKSYNDILEYVRKEISWGGFPGAGSPHRAALG